MKIDGKEELKPFGVHFEPTHHTSVTQKPDHQYMPNPKSTRDNWKVL